MRKSRRTSIPCRECGKLINTGNFHKGLTLCNSCLARSTRSRRLQYRYDITLDDYEDILLRQKGMCAICQNNDVGEKGLHVDHNHKTGRVRGLLCGRCNVGIGIVRENSDRLRAIAFYLREYGRQ